MTVTNAILLGAYADIAQQTYDEPLDTNITPDVPAGAFGTYTELQFSIDDELLVPTIDHPTGFQGRAFFNETTNELVITDLTLGATGASQQRSQMEKALQ